MVASTLSNTSFCFFLSAKTNVILTSFTLFLPVKSILETGLSLSLRNVILTVGVLVVKFAPSLPGIRSFGLTLAGVVIVTMFELPIISSISKAQPLKK